jgi:hypothetical protein
MIKSRKIRWEGHVTRMGEEDIGKVRRKETTRKTKT